VAVAVLGTLQMVVLVVMVVVVVEPLMVHGLVVLV
jgi:hypothetical protein